MKAPEKKYDQSTHEPRMMNEEEVLIMRKNMTYEERFRLLMRLIRLGNEMKRAGEKLRGR